MIKVKPNSYFHAHSQLVAINQLTSLLSGLFQVAKEIEIVVIQVVNHDSLVHG